MITVAKAMVKCLEAEGISTVFGYPGAAICPFYDALSHSSIRHVLVRQEQMAGHEASGYARMTGKPAVCIVTSGPGALNLISAIASAYADSIPMVCITGQVPRWQLGTDAFQEVDTTGSVEPFSKYSYIVKDPNDIPRVFKEAFYLAGSGRPGPVIIDVPQDVQNEKISFEYPDQVRLRSYNPTVEGHPGQIKRVMTALKNARRPLIFAGGGIFNAGARTELQQFVHDSNIPVIHTMMGIGALETDDLYNLGMAGSHGCKTANYALNHADLLLLIGARAADRAIRNPEELKVGKKVIHIDIDPAEIGKNLPVDIPVVGDAKHVLNAMQERLNFKAPQEWVDELRAIKEEPHKLEPSYEGCINPKLFVRKLSAAAEKNAVLCADVGQNQIWSANNYLVKDGRFFTSGGMGTMGYSVPCAIGAKFAAPNRQVFAICGDGSFQMQMMELGTIAQNQVPVKIIVMTNHTLGMVRELQERSYADNEIAVDLTGSPNNAALAAAYGIPSSRISSDDEVDAAIEKLLAAEGPYLLECFVSSKETTL